MEKVGQESVPVVKETEETRETSPTQQLRHEVVAVKEQLDARYKDMEKGYSIASKMARTEAEKRLLSDHYDEMRQEWSADRKKAEERQCEYEHMRGAEIIPEELRSEWDEFVDWNHEGWHGEFSWNIIRGLDILEESESDDEADEAFKEMRKGFKNPDKWNMMIKGVARFSKDGKKFGERCGLPESEYESTSAVRGKSLFEEVYDGFYFPTQPYFAEESKKVYEKARRLIDEGEGVIADGKYKKWCQNCKNSFFLATADYVFEGIKKLDAEGGTVEEVDEYLDGVFDSFSDQRPYLLDGMKRFVGEFAKNGAAYREAHGFEDPDKPKPKSFWEKLLQKISA